jgi:hypothetical protein
VPSRHFASRQASVERRHASGRVSPSAPTANPEHRCGKIGRVRFGLVFECRSALRLRIHTNTRHPYPRACPLPRGLVSSGVSQPNIATRSAAALSGCPTMQIARRRLRREAWESACSFRWKRGVKICGVRYGAGRRAPKSGPLNFGATGSSELQIVQSHTRSPLGAGHNRATPPANAAVPVVARFRSHNSTERPSSHLRAFGRGSCEPYRVASRAAAEPRTPSNLLSSFMRLER